MKPNAEAQAILDRINYTTLATVDTNGQPWNSGAHISKVSIPKTFALMAKYLLLFTILLLPQVVARACTSKQNALSYST